MIVRIVDPPISPTQPPIAIDSDLLLRSQKYSNEERIVNVNKLQSNDSSKRSFQLLFIQAILNPEITADIIIAIPSSSNDHQPSRELIKAE